MQETVRTIPFHRPMPLGKLGIQDKITEVLNSGMLTNGENCRKLEDQIAKLYDADHAIATSCCTQGLFLCLAGLWFPIDANVHNVT